MKTHYANMSTQNAVIFKAVKLIIFRRKKDVSLIFVQNIDCGYPQSMFESKNKKIIYTPVNHNFTI